MTWRQGHPPRHEMETPPKKPDVLYHHERDDYYECLGCGALLEVPQVAVLRAGRSPAAVVTNPENRMLWVELQRLDHAPCAKFLDAHQAALARSFRRHPLLEPRGGGFRPGNANA